MRLLSNRFYKFYSNSQSKIIKETIDSVAAIVAIAYNLLVWQENILFNLRHLILIKHKLQLIQDCWHDFLSRTTTKVFGYILSLW